MIDDPIEIVMLARHFGEAYLEEKARADKLQATLEMVSQPKCSPIQSRQMKLTPAKIVKSQG
ncbi:hypothetical protein OFY05_23330 (plasmid) [Pseudocitrobacter faecalis]|nr:hypothetical protein OFY05_23330 [Pseudocitrobacter faecalis]